VHCTRNGGSDAHHAFANRRPRLLVAVNLEAHAPRPDGYSLAGRKRSRLMRRSPAVCFVPGRADLKLVEIFLPLYDDRGRRFPAAFYGLERDRLVERFGGLTTHTRSPARGLWKTGAHVKRDDLVIFEVMIRRVDRKWWMDYRFRLQKRFKQKELLVRVQDVKVL
jgi:hypothetical protein